MENPTPITVAIFDDSADIRDGYSSLFKLYADIAVVGVGVQAVGGGHDRAFVQGLELGGKQPGVGNRAGLMGCVL